MKQLLMKASPGRLLKAEELKSTDKPFMEVTCLPNDEE